jgi:hypothetical protein
VTIHSLVAKQVEAAHQASEARFRVTEAVAKAMDDCLAQFTGPHEANVAKDLKRRITTALEVSIQGHATTTPPSSQDPITSCSSNQTWAEIVQAPRVGTTAVSAPAPPKEVGTAPNRSTTRKAPPKPSDHRLIINMPEVDGIRLRTQASPYSIRKAICTRLAVSLSDIPKASPTKTGWAITPANAKVRSYLLVQENREKLIRSVEGTGLTIPQTWINYAVQGVESSLRMLDGTFVPATPELVSDEVLSQTRIAPESVRASRHGPNTVTGLTTWIVSFLKPVRPFRLFGTSDYSKEIRKSEGVQLHNPGCQGYCKGTRCTRDARCHNCKERIVTHTGPANENCTLPSQCANCFGPYPAGHWGCPAKPRREHGTLIPIPRKELEKIRRLGQRATEAIQHGAAHAEALAQSTRRTSSPEASTLTSHTASSQVRSPSPAPRGDKRPHEPTNPPALTQAPHDAGLVEPQTPSPRVTRFPRKAKDASVNLNISHMSARSMRSNHTHPTVASEEDSVDIEMTDNVRE